MKLYLYFYSVFTYTFISTSGSDVFSNLISNILAPLISDAEKIPLAMQSASSDRKDKGESKEKIIVLRADPVINYLIDDKPKRKPLSDQQSSLNSKKFEDLKAPWQQNWTHEKFKANSSNINERIIKVQHAVKDTSFRKRLSNNPQSEDDTKEQARFRMDPVLNYFKEEKAKISRRQLSDEGQNLNLIMPKDWKAPWQDRWTEKKNKAYLSYINRKSNKGQHESRSFHEPLPSNTQHRQDTNEKARFRMDPVLNHFRDEKMILRRKLSDEIQDFNLGMSKHWTMMARSLDAKEV